MAESQELVVSFRGLRFHPKSTPVSLILDSITSPTLSKRRRGPVKVPCDDCILRASKKNDVNGSIELCQKCTDMLQRPRRRPEHGNARRVRPQETAIIDAALGARSDPIDMPWSDDGREQHALQFFIQNSAPQLAGYFDSPFWQRMVLQAGRKEPAVMHAIAAIGSLHERLLRGSLATAETQNPTTRFALEQCNKSIQHLVSPLVPGKSPDLRLMLTTCVLFTCFEALQGHCEQAIIHATQGYSLIQQYAMDPDNKQWDVGAFAVELDQLTLMMRRLQTQSKGLMGKEFNVVPDPEAISAQRPTEFNSLHEARAGLELVLNQLTVFFMDMELDDQFYDLAVSNAEKHLIFAPWLQSWEKAFSTYLAQNQPNLGPEERKAAMILKAHHLVAEILSDVDLSLGELGWDKFQEKFAAIVELGAAVLDDTKEADTSVPGSRWQQQGVFVNTPSATLSFTLGIVDPLYEVCTRCRDPGLRRRALDLLARHPRQECMWSSWSAWKVGKFVMNLEEEDIDSAPKVAADVPAEQRVSEAWLDFAENPNGGEGRGRVAYKRAVPRATARFALNPGLFQDMKTNETGFVGEIEAGTVPSPSAYNSPSAESNSTAPSWTWNGASGDVNTPGMIDFDAWEDITSFQAFQNTPPQESS